MSLDAKEVKANADIVAVISSYIELKKDGDKYKGLCPFHSEKSPSFTVYPAKKRYNCYGCGEWGDVIDFLIKKGGLTFSEALASLADPNNISAVPLDEREKNKSYKAVPEVVWTQVIPSVRSEGDSMYSHYKYGKPSLVWDYVSDKGELIGAVCRFEVNGKKVVLPYIYASDGVRKQWRWQGFRQPRPLKNLDKLAANKTAPVLLLEGEKTCSAGEWLFPRAVSTCWIGGVNGIHAVDWTPLAGRIVVMGPDNDEVGFTAMHTIYEIIKDFPGTVVKWLINPPDAEKGWDIADADWTPEEATVYSSTKIIAYPGKDFKYGENKATTIEWDVKPSFLAEKKENKKEGKGSNGEAFKNTYFPSPKKEGSEGPPDGDGESKGESESWFRMLGSRKEGNGMVFYFYAYATKTVIGLTPSAMTKNNLLQLAPLDWWRNTFPDKRNLFSQEEAVSYLIEYSSKSGVFSDKRIRGRGAWVEGSNVVIHTGDKLIVNGVNKSFAEHFSKFIYERGEELGYSTDGGLNNAESIKLIELSKRLNWERDINAYLVLGWCVVAIICGALPWRPHIWITGGAGTGKSFLLKELIRSLLGNIGQAFQGKVTEPGLRQYLRYDALPVVIDEAESENKHSQNRIEAVLALVRGSSTNDGGDSLVGGNFGSPLKFKTRSCFCLASIGVGATEQSDKGRFSILGLRKDERHNAKEIFLKWKEDFFNTVTEEYCESFRARTIRLLPVILENAKHFSNAAAAVIGEQRAGDQVGVLLSGAYSLSSDKVINFDNAKEWIERQNWDDEKGVGDSPDESKLMNRLLEYIVGVEGTHGRVDRTIGELVLIAMKMKMNDVVVTPQVADERLKRIGLRAVFISEKGVADWYLYVSNTDVNLVKIFEGTLYYKNHNKILGRMKGAETVESYRFATGIKSRAVRLSRDILFQNYQIDVTPEDMIMTEEQKLKYLEALGSGNQLLLNVNPTAEEDHPF